MRELVALLRVDIPRLLVVQMQAGGGGGGAPAASCVKHLTLDRGTTPLSWKKTVCMTMLMRLPRPTLSATARASTTYSCGLRAAICRLTLAGRAASISCKQRSRESALAAKKHVTSSCQTAAGCQHSHLCRLKGGVDHQHAPGLQAGQAVVLGEVGLQVHAQVVCLIHQVAAGQGLGAETEVGDCDAPRLMRIVTTDMQPYRRQSKQCSQPLPSAFSRWLD